MRSRGFTLIELNIVIGIIIILSSVLIAVINPLDKILRARDTDRIASVEQIHTAIQSYITTKNTTPNCDELTQCPTDFTLDGTDSLSELLITNEYLKSIPEPPTGALSDKCDYHVYLFPSDQNKYLLSWCFESWTKDRVATVNQNTHYFCDWDAVNEVAVCFTGTDYDIPGLGG